MADLKVTKMVMKVDLQCCKCNRKIKKVLCRYPQIRDQVYDEKKNTVTITVVCCSPEKIKEKIACKTGFPVEIFREPPKPPPDSVPSKPVPPPEREVVYIPYPVCVCCCCCYGGGPCYHERGSICYDGCGWPEYGCSSGNRGYCVCRC